MDNRNVSRVTTMLSTAAGQEKYLNWFKDEVTQALLAGAKELTHPRMDTRPDASHALQENGRIMGAYQILDFFTDPPRSDGTAVAAQQTQKALKPTYGSEQILKEQKDGSEKSTE